MPFSPRLHPKSPLALLLLLHLVARPALAFGDESHDILALAPGTYELNASGELHSKTIHAHGALTLIETTTRDKFKKEFFPLIGWTRVDFKKLGAPLDPLAPPSSSHDPHNPGVLVLRSFQATNDRTGKRFPVLLIGTLFNAERTRNSVDGGGIGLFVEKRRGKCFSGSWSQWGIVVSGHGHFLLCPQR